MPIQFTIIGLGQVGTSIGLALSKIKDQVIRVGNDRELSVARQAERMGAVDKVMINLPSSVEKADVIILALPVDEIRETIEVIAQDLKPGSVLIDTSPVKGAVMQWAKELLPGEDRYFAALTPSLNPVYLMETDESVENAHADLFEHSLMLITTMPGIDDSALNLVTQLTQVLGATPLFSDTYESDGLIAYSHMLPRLVAAALINATIDQPGWREARKLAGHAYAQITEPVEHFEETKELGQAALLNSENTIRMIDMMIAELREIREAIVEKDTAALSQRLNHAREGRIQWIKERMAAEWDKRPGSNVPLPTGGEMIGRLFGGKMFGSRKDKEQKQ